MSVKGGESKFLIKPDFGIALFEDDEEAERLPHDPEH